MLCMARFTDIFMFLVSVAFQIHRDFLHSCSVFSIFFRGRSRYYLLTLKLSNISLLRSLRTKYLSKILVEKLDTIFFFRLFLNSKEKKKMQKIQIVFQGLTDLVPLSFLQKNKFPTKIFVF